jgi:hypothetical protein
LARCDTPEKATHKISANLQVTERNPRNNTSTSFALTAIRLYTE